MQSSIVSLIKSILPRPLKDFLRKKRDRLKNSYQAWTDPQQYLVPPQELIFVGYGDFVKIGDEFARYFIDLGQLMPNENVLDVGCGIGRMALPLTKYMSRQGEYWGFDIVKEGIDWCAERYAYRFPNFHFQFSDVYNQHYNPDGKQHASEYVFPFADGYFDFVFLTSVFTHMLPPDLENYLSEVSRVLKTGGRCFITYFLINDESRESIHGRKSTLDFAHPIGDCLTTERDDPESAIAHPEERIRLLYSHYALEIVEPIQYGSWSGRQSHLTFQDVILAKKKGPSKQ